MDLSHALQWLHDTAFAAAIRENGVLFPWIESVHVLAITIVVGSISIVDLRLIGLASMNRGVRAMTAEVLPITWTAFGFAVLTGSALFSSHATGYAQNDPFRLKMVLLVLAGLNMLAFHAVMGRGSGPWSLAGTAPWQGRLAGAISLLLWVGIVAFGRWIGFTVVS